MNGKIPKKNYQRMMEAEIQQWNGPHKPRLLLHSCCGPCSSAVIERLVEDFEITVLFDNPNIHPKAEYDHRLKEQKEVLSHFPEVKLVDTVYEPRRYFQAVQGLEKEGEGSERCTQCYAVRMRKACEYAKEKAMDYYTTTLSVSPYKNVEKINRLGEEIASEIGVKHLPSDFKKKGGYQRSIELSKAWSIYRQHYCGCIYSKYEVESQEENAEEKEESKDDE